MDAQAVEFRLCRNEAESVSGTSKGKGREERGKTLSPPPFPLCAQTSASGDTTPSVIQPVFLRWCIRP